LEKICSLLFDFLSPNVKQEKQKVKKNKVDDDYLHTGIRGDGRTVV
jgi:hypothetical protein